jgi:hypothetical protein
MPYDTIEEIDMRLHGTIIRYDGKPVFVGSIKPLAGGKFGMTLWLDQHNSFEVIYDPEDPKLDLSPFEPGYSLIAGSVYWIYRIAKRMYQQGGNDRNTHAKPVGEYRGFGQGGWNLLAAYSVAPVNKSIDAGLYRSLIAGYLAYTKPTNILNNHVAVGVKLDKEDKPCVFVEYKGNEVGFLRIDADDSIYVETDNESLSFNPWCVGKLHQAGIRVGA